MADKLVFHDCMNTYVYKWRFPKIGLPLNHPVLNSIFHYEPEFWGTPMDENPHLISAGMYHVPGTGAPVPGRPGRKGPSEAAIDGYNPQETAVCIS